MANIGRIEKVDLREVWKDEAGQFTPWLAMEENIQLLSDLIGISLEVQSQEQSVGSFRADILCKDTANDHWVLIENQLERTDHTHLGQLLTYAAGLEAVTIIWIAQHFTEEHRAALDWLNEITEDNINFFGIEIELIRIGNSDIAPDFNIVSKPNDWSKAVKNTAKRGELTETKIFQLDYWNAFKEMMKESRSQMKIPTPTAQGWLVLSIGRSGFQIVTRVTIREKQIGCYLNILGQDRLPLFDLLLQQHKSQVDGLFDGQLDWRRMEDRKESHIELYHDCDPAKQSDWPAQYLWLKTNVEKLYGVFNPIIKQLPRQFQEGG